MFTFTLRPLIILDLASAVTVILDRFSGEINAGTESRKGGDGSQRHNEEKNGVPRFGLM